MENEEKRVDEEIKKEKESENVEEIEEDEETLENVEETSDDIEETLKKKEEELEELQNRYLRLQADFANYKNRMEQEKSNIVKYASEKLIQEILPILDNFERALESESNKDGFYDGVELIYTQIINALKNHGLTEVEALGEEFDPNVHNAVMTEESDEYDPDTVMDVLQKGYKLNEKLIRPSMVKVAK